MSRPPGTRARYPASVPVTRELRERIDRVAAERVIGPAVLVDVLLTRALDQLGPVEGLGPAPTPDRAWLGPPTDPRRLVFHLVAPGRGAIGDGAAPTLCCSTPLRDLPIGHTYTDRADDRDRLAVCCPSWPANAPASPPEPDTPQYRAPSPEPS